MSYFQLTDEQLLSREKQYRALAKKMTHPMTRAFYVNESRKVRAEKRRREVIKARAVE